MDKKIAIIGVTAKWANGLQNIFIKWVLRW